MRTSAETTILDANERLKGPKSRVLQCLTVEALTAVVAK
jgi:hypothetical protein